MPGRKQKGYFRGMLDLFRLHDRQVLLIMTVTYAAQGLRTLGGAATFIYFKEDLGIKDEAQAQVLISTTFLPWYIKPVYGLVSDSFPICGSHRKAYLIIASVISAFSYLSFMIDLGLFASMFALIGGQLGQVIADIMADALMVVESRDDHENGSSFLQAYSWTVLSVVSLGGGFLGTYLSYIGVHPSTILCLLSAAPIMLTVVVLRYKEPRRDSIPTLSESLSRLYKALSVPSTFRCLLFIFLLYAFTPSIGPVMKYFLTNELKFSYEFIYFVSGLSGICYITGSFLFSSWFKAWPFRHILPLGILLLVLCSSLDIALVFRLYEALHIPGTVFYMFGAYVGSSISAGFMMMPVLVLTAQLCPKDLEATMYAFITSLVNFGSYCSELTGSGITKLVMPSPGDYSNFYLIILTQMGMMMLSICFVWLLPKNLRPTENSNKD